MSGKLQKVIAYVRSFISEPTVFIIDRQKLENHFLLILKRPEQIKTVEELTTARMELILFSGW